MAKYKVGDKVRVRENADSIPVSHGQFVLGMNEYKGKVMTIKKIIKPLSCDYYVYTLENCVGLFADWHWNELHLAPVEGINKKLIVTTDGETTTAKLIDGKQTIKTATARCSKDDEFCFETGAQIAVDRLLGKKPVGSGAPKFTKADLKDGMFGFNMVHDCEVCQWFVVCNGSFVYETGGFDRIDALDDSMSFLTNYGYVGAVIDGAVSFDNARGMYKRSQGIVYERK